MDLSKTQLRDRTLFSDGDSVVPADHILELLSAGANSEGIFVNTMTEDIEQFNKYVPKNEQIQLKSDTRTNDISWKLPQEYAETDPVEYVVKRFFDMAETKQFNEKRKRLVDELNMYEDMNLLPVLRVLIYIINTLRENNIVWGVGRGSSVSSYVLYVIGVHDVDSVEYDLDMHDFIRT